MVLALRHILTQRRASRSARIPFDAASKGANITLTYYNSDAAGGASTWNSARTAVAMPAGKKFYWEVWLTSLSSATLSAAGMADGSASMSNVLGGTSGSWMVQSSNALSFSGVTRDYASAFPAFSVNDVLGFSFDRLTGKALVAVNGTWINSGNPVTGSGSVVSAMTSGSWYPAVSANGTGGQVLRLVTDENSFRYPMPDLHVSYGNAS